MSSLKIAGCRCCFNLFVKVLQSQISSFKLVHTGTPSFAVPKNIKGKTISSQKWLQRQVNDHYAAKARKLGYRARSAFKLIEIEEKFELFKPGMRILDCGAAPGAWSQVCAKLINSSSYNRIKPMGTLVSVDLLDIEPIPGAMVLPNSDFTDPVTQSKIMSRFTIGESEDMDNATEPNHQNHQNSRRPVKLDGVISDMAPNATGHHETDHFRIVKLFDAVLEFASEHAAPNSFLIAKLWQGSEVNRVLQRLKGEYKSARLFKPDSSRSESSEIFVLGRGKMS